jgi:hypothetical protein
MQVFYYSKKGGKMKCFHRHYQSITAILLLFALLLLCWELPAQSVSEPIIKPGMNGLARQSKRQADRNLSELSNSMKAPLLPYGLILAQHTSTENPQTSGPNTPGELPDGLMNLLNNQMTNLMILEAQWQALEQQSLRLSQTNKELLALLDELRETIRQLRQNLEIALERIQDAESGAIALLDENAEIFNRARLAAANIANLQYRLERSRRGAMVSFAAGSVSFGVGITLLAEGIRSDNRAIMWAGAGTAAGGALVWAVGHYVFQWW